MIDCGIVDKQHEFIGTVTGYIETFPNKEYQNLLREYVIEGKTTREIASETNISFQAVSDKLKKVLPTKELLLETQYLHLMKNVKISQEEFYKIFPNESKQTFIILSHLTKRGRISKRKIVDVINDSEIPYFIKKQLFSYYQKENTFKLENGDIIKLQNNSILKYIVIKYFHSSTFSSNDIFEKYQEIVKEIKEKESNIKEYAPNRSGFKVFLFKNPVILPTNINQYRYVNIASMDKESIIKECELYKYKDIEISAKLIYDKKQDVFNSLGIKNHYELYFFLKKSINPQDYNIVFKKAPHFIFGNGNLKKQVEETIKNNPTLSTKELSLLLEEKYGISPQTSCANYLKNKTAS